MQTPYSQIMDFCKNKNVSELQSKILLHKFYKDYYEVIENYKKKENKEPTKEILEGFESTLLSETTLQGNLKLSEEEIEMALSKEIKKHDRITSWLINIIWCHCFIYFYNFIDSDFKFSSESSKRLD